MQVYSTWIASLKGTHTQILQIAFLKNYRFWERIQLQCILFAFHLISITQKIRSKFATIESPIVQISNVNAECMVLLQANFGQVSLLKQIPLKWRNLLILNTKRYVIMSTHICCFIHIKNIPEWCIIVILVGCIKKIGDE